mmetsp:Transcript_24342/g.52376  ORF Transcript_24342/g.52376 Transcript_24342/m.52376 type:complete len:255 (+) Transcript_24342:1069-1833(+)
MQTRVLGGHGGLSRRDQLAGDVRPRSQQHHPRVEEVLGPLRFIQVKIQRRRHIAMAPTVVQLRGAHAGVGLLIERRLPARIEELVDWAVPKHRVWIHVEDLVVLPEHPHQQPHVAGEDIPELVKGVQAHSAKVQLLPVLLRHFLRHGEALVNAADVDDARVPRGLERGLSRRVQVLRVFDYHKERRARFAQGLRQAQRPSERRFSVVVRANQGRRVSLPLPQRLAAMEFSSVRRGVGAHQARRLRVRQRGLDGA